jgi:hypothetical protein
MTVAREYKIAKFGMLDSRGVLCAFSGATAATAAFLAAVPGVSALSAGGSAIL